MKILFLSDNFPPESNAAASRVYERALHWLRSGHEVTVITCAPNFPEGRVYEGYTNAWRKVEFMSGIRVVRVKTFISANEGFALRILDFVSYMVMAVLAGMFERRPEVVVATSPQFFAAVGGWILSVLKWRPFVFELSDLWPASIRAVGAMKKGLALALVEKLELFLYRRAARVVALTPAFREDLIARGIDGGKIDVVINGVELSSFAPVVRDAALARRHGLEGKITFGYIGTHGMAHALDNILRAAALLRDRDDIRFLLVGSGAERDRLLALRQALRLDNVVMLPRQPKADMPAYWGLCDVALVHLKNNPVFATVIPSKIFEAMAMGLPMLLAGPLGQAAGIIGGEEAGLCVPGENPEALAEAVAELADMPDDRARLAHNSLLAAPRYSRERQAQEFLAALEKAVQPR